MERDAVSVVIPTFNRARLVTRAVESALEQSRPAFEIIVVDDGSTDDTADRLKPYRDRIRYVYQENRGASAAQNVGLDLARAPWVAILASDDIWLPEKLERQMCALRALGPEYGACFTDCEYMGTPVRSGTAFEVAGLIAHGEASPLEDPFTYVLARHPALFVQSMVASRELLLALGSFDERLAVGEDTDLIFRLALRTKFCIVNSVLVRIDRDPSTTRLSAHLERPDDHIFGCIELRYLKWLSLPGMRGKALRMKLEEQLAEIYYEWAIAGLYRRRFHTVASTLTKLRQRRVPSRSIAATLVSRAAKKLLP
jgi:glycosyltransferase involved in cell wall biosynthesis